MFRACMQKVPGTVSDGHVGAGVLSATSFGWVAKQIDHLTGEKGRRGVSIESIGMKMLKALRDSMVEYVGKVIAVKRTATPTSQAAGPADNAIDDDVAEGQKAPQGAVAAQHHGNARVHGEGGNGGGGDAEAGAGRSETEKSSSESESESESEEEDEAVKRKDEEEYEEEEEENKDENGEKWEGGKDEEGGDEEVEFVVEYVEGTVEAGAAEEAVGSADQGNEEEKDDGAGNATRSADVGKEKGEVGVEAPGNGQDEAACEGGGKVSVDAGEGPNNTGEQEAGEPPSRVPVTPLRLPARLPASQAHSRDVQQHPVVDAGLPGTARRSVTTQVAGKSSGAPPAAPPVAAPPPADPKSDFLRAHLGARKATAPSVTLPELGKSATPMSVNATAPTPGASVVNVAAEKGVSAALATGGRADKHADLAVVMAHFEAAKRPEHAPVMAIMDTAHVVPSATHGGGSTEQTAATAAVAEINAGRKEKDDNGKGKANRYIGKSREKMELAYEHAIAFVVYDGYVSKVLMKELTVLNPGELDKWKEVWAEVKLLPTGMWTVMRARGLCHPRARFDDILGRYRGYASSGVALHDVLWPAIWFPIIEDTEEGKEETTALLSAMVNRVSMCAAYGKVAASAAFGKVDASVEGKADEKVEMGAQALAASACAIWCFLETGASVLGAVGEGKAAAMVAGAGEARANDFKEVMHAVIDIARSRQAPAGEVAHNVAPSVQSQAVARAFAKGVEEVEADMIARATVETLAFWGMCPVAGPKLKAQGIDVPCDARMEYHMDHRGRKGEKVKQSKGSSKRKKSKQGMGSTDA
ncbi:unnamed protein product [Closterium sp. NIES-65]|nr:unnamed protein product [Closterium sp. NIES-65]